MFRLFPIFCAALVVCLVATGSVCAQEPPANWPSSAPEERGVGFYFAMYKLFLLVIPVMLWAQTTGWIAKDLDEFSSAIKQSPLVWQPVVIFTFLGVFLVLGITIPIFAIGYFLVVVAWAAPLFTYLFLRDAKVGEDRRILTPAGMQRLAVSIVKGGKQKEKAPQMPWELGPPVDLTAVGPNSATNQAAQIEARQSPVYISVKMLIADALQARAEKIRLEYTADAVGVRYMIDGVWIPANPKVHEKSLSIQRSAMRCSWFSNASPRSIRKIVVRSKRENSKRGWSRTNTTPFSSVREHRPAKWRCLRSF